MSDHEPYLSIVATSRNDDHGGNLADRTQIFVDMLAAHCAAFDLPAELILVEWNPPAERAPLADTIRWPDQPSPLTIRTITVPASIHARFKHADALPLFQMKAKNVGIRRARGQFILVTNIDIVLSQPLMAHIARRKLETGRLYRVERHDVAPAPTVGLSQETTLEFCQSHVIRKNSRAATIDSRTGETTRVYPQRYRVLGHFPYDLLRSIARGIPPWSTAGRDRISTNRAYIRDEFSRPQLLTNAAGDFMLMDRASWADLHGYAEWDIYSFHLDAIFCHQAAASGRREIFLKPPMQVWHIEHAHGSGFAPEAPDALWTRLELARVPWLEGERAQEIIRDLHRQRTGPAINGPDWGLADTELAECQPETNPR